MKVWKKLSAVALSLIMVMALCAPAFASSFTQITTADAAGAFASTNKDVATKQEEVLRIPKDITAFNKDALDVAAPTITYKYTIEGGEAGKSVTDDPSDHTVNSAVTMTTFEGNVTGVTMKSTSSTTPTATTTTLAWTTADTLKTSETGSVGTAGTNDNTKYVDIDFSQVAFGKTGVYRYVITEAINNAPTDTYAMSGVTDGGVHTLYLDVYVKPSATGTFGATALADDWDIYGYALFASNDDVTPNTTKLTGFVGYDSYYTFNLTVSKDIDNDTAMEKAAHRFPFSVQFINDTVTKDVLIKENVTTPATSTDPTAGLLSHTINSEFANTLTIGDNGTTHGSVKYIGIPVGITTGTSVVVTEKNDVLGVTYGASTTTNSTANNDATAIVTNATKNVTLAARTVGATTSDTIEFKNTLMNISPTGVTLRYAPYLAMMGAGIVALPLSLRKKEEEF